MSLISMAKRRGVRIINVQDIDNGFKFKGKKYGPYKHSIKALYHPDTKIIAIESNPFNYVLNPIRHFKFISRETALKHELIHSINENLTEREVYELEKLPEQEIIRRLKLR